LEEGVSSSKRRLKFVLEMKICKEMNTFHLTRFEKEHLKKKAIDLSSNYLGKKSFVHVARSFQSKSKV
jgi:hypothetical protein